MESNIQNTYLDNAFVLIIGDIMLDEYIIGTHNRQSPEADIPVILSQKKDYRLGGAGNVAVNLRTLGISTGIVSVVGSDTPSSIIQSLIKEKGIDSYLIEDDDRPTTVKQRIVNQHYEQYLRIDTETTDDLTISQETEVILKVKRLISSQKISAIVIQDYNKGVLTDYVVKQLQEIAKEYSIPTFVDPKKSRFNLLSNCTYFKPNLRELSLAINEDVPSDPTSISQAIETLNLHCENIFVTLGEKGIYYENLKTRIRGIVEGKPLEKADVSGAGDTVIASLVWSYLSGSPIKKMATIANESGAAVCSKKGVSSVGLEDLK